MQALLRGGVVSVSWEGWVNTQILDQRRLIDFIRDQLPRTVADKVSINLVSDPYHLRTRVSIIDYRGRRYETTLAHETFGDRVVACRLPDTFIARLAAEV